MSQTKATDIIKRLLDNDLASSILLAISHNDEHAFQVALSKANITEDDLTLSKDEYDNLVKGIKPSGELDLLTWEGYYVVTNVSQSDPLALMILSGTEKVYWGTQSQVLGNPDSYAVEYQITPDNKLEFSTQADGFVSVSLQRAYDEASATAAVQFSGTCNGKDISGVKAQPPIDALKLGDRSRQQAPIPGRPVMLLDEEDDPWWHQHQAVVHLMTIITLLGGAVAVFQIYLWVRDKAWRREGSERVRGMLEEEVPLVESIAKQGIKDPEVKLDGAGHTVDDAITGRINQDLQRNPPDWDRIPDDIANERESLARTVAEGAVRRYVTDRALPEFRRSLRMFRAFPSYDRMLEDVSGIFVDRTVSGLMDRFGPSSFKFAVLPLVLYQRELHFARNYRNKDESYRVKERELQDIRNRKDALQKQIDETDKRIEQLEDEGKAQEALEEEKRRDQLKDEKSRVAEEEQAKQRERDEESQAKEDAKAKKEEAERDAEHDDSKERWEEMKKIVFGK